MKVFFFSIWILSIFVSCSSGSYNKRVPAIELLPTAKGVKISKNLPPTSCEEIGLLFSSVQADGNHLEKMVRYIRKDLANKASKMGANYVVLETLDNTNYNDSLIMAASSTAYSCFVPNLSNRSSLLFEIENE